MNVKKHFLLDDKLVGKECSNTFIAAELENGKLVICEKESEEPVNNCEFEKHELYEGLLEFNSILSDLESENIGIFPDFLRLSKTDDLESYFDDLFSITFHYVYLLLFGYGFIKDFNPKLLIAKSYVEKVQFNEDITKELLKAIRRPIDIKVVMMEGKRKLEEEVEQVSKELTSILNIIYAKLVKMKFKKLPKKIVEKFDAEKPVSTIGDIVHDALMLYFASIEKILLLQYSLTETGESRYSFENLKKEREYFSIFKKYVIQKIPSDIEKGYPVDYANFLTRSFNLEVSFHTALKETLSSNVADNEFFQEITKYVFSNRDKMTTYSAIIDNMLRSNLFTSIMKRNARDFGIFIKSLSSFF